jgi:lysozyme family protein
MSQVPSLQSLAATYSQQWANCIPAASRIAEIDTAIALILRSQPRYETVANKLPNMPWYVIALIHGREADYDFRCHLYNGDPLSARTVHEPKGQPANGAPPFTWEESAWGALRYDHLDRADYSSIAGICFALEFYNGPGYFHRGMPSPYLWSGSNQQKPGKFTADGVFSPTQMDRQQGAITVLRRMVTQNKIPLRLASPPAPTPPAIPDKITALADLPPASSLLA